MEGIESDTREGYDKDMKYQEHTVPEGTRILLHCCCGPCSTSSIERLRYLGYAVELHYANDNIFPESEWEKRLTELEKVGIFFTTEIHTAPYDHASWQKEIQGHERDEEGGQRCSLCFSYNLSIAAEKAKELGIEFFTTTLSVSPHKNSMTIFSIGEKKEGFVPFNFKKKDGYKRSIELSEMLDLYRQDYCGCEFSRSQKEQ